MLSFRHLGKVISSSLLESPSSPLQMGGSVGNSSQLLGTLSDSVSLGLPCPSFVGVGSISPYFT